MVARRMAEIGIRMALGATGADVILTGTARVDAVGRGGSLAGAWGAGQAGRLVKSLLFGVSATDAWTVLAATFILIATAFSSNLATR